MAQLGVHVAALNNAKVRGDGEHNAGEADANAGVAARTRAR